MKNSDKILGFSAYISLLLAGICKVLNAFIENLKFVAVLDTIGYLFLVITVALAAFPFQLKMKKVAWKIIYWVLVLLALIGAILKLTTLLK